MKAAGDHKFLEAAEHLAKAENLQKVSEKEIERELDILNAL